MKNIYLLFYILLSFFIAGCIENGVQPVNEQRIIEEIKINEDDHLQTLLGQFKTDKIANGRSASILNEIDLNIALKKTDTLTGIVQYAFSITDGMDKTLQNFILTELPDNTLYGHVFIYNVDSTWLEEVGYFPGWDKYTGTFTIIDLEGNVLAENNMMDGTSLEEGKQTNGRINGSICYSTTWEVTVSSKYGSYTYYETETNCVTYSSSGDTQIGGIPAEPAPLIPDEDEEPTPKKISLADLWEKDVCTSNAFNSNLCLSSVWNKLKSSNAAVSLLDKFENSTWIDLCIDAGLSTSANAQTSISGSNVTINFNTSKLGRSQLSIARTFLHEMVHAELWRKVKSVGGNVSQNNFPGILDYYRRFVKNWQHQQMAAHYINTIANGLSLFDGASHPLSYYEDIAWIGLWKVPNYNTADPNDFIETQAWKDLSTSEQNRIKNAIANFQSTENTNCQ